MTVKCQGNCASQLTFLAVFINESGKIIILMFLDVSFVGDIMPFFPQYQPDTGGAKPARFHPCVPFLQVMPGCNWKCFSLQGTRYTA